MKKNNYFLNKNSSPIISKNLFKQFENITVYEIEGEKYIKVNDFIDVCKGASKCTK